MEKEFEVKLANGYTVGIYNSSGEIVIGLINPDDYVVSDIELKGKQLEDIKEVVK